MYTIGAFAIILNEEGQVLLSHRRDRDLWNLPGGGVESRELPTEAVVREVKEETGLDVAIDRLIGVYGKVDKDDLVFSFICRVVGGQLLLSNEADKHRFFPPEKLPPNIPPRQVERIQDALQSTGQPIFRRHMASSTQDAFGKD